MAIDSQNALSLARRVILDILARYLNRPRDEIDLDRRLYGPSNSYFESRNQTNEFFRNVEHRVRGLSDQRLDYNLEDINHIASLPLHDVIVYTAGLLVAQNPRVLSVRRDSMLDFLHDAAPKLRIREEYDQQLVGLLYATTRKGETGSKPVVFTDERNKTLTFGALRVRVPEKHKLGKVERPWHIGIRGWTLYREEEDEERHFVIKARAHLSEDAFIGAINDAEKDHALVFVHGFHTTFDEGAFRLAQIVWDTQFKGVPILFAWPSKGKLLSYLYDRESAEFSRGPFVELLRLVQAKTKVSAIHIIAHSMGNQIVTGGLAGLSDLPKPLAELILAAPDVDRDLFIDQVSRMKGVSRGMTLYASSADKALHASHTCAQGPRAGDVTDPDGPIVVPNVETIDVTAVGEELFGLNHNVFAAQRSLIDDIGRLILNSVRPPNERSPQIRCVPEGSDPPRYWRYVE